MNVFEPTIPHKQKEPALPQQTKADGYAPFLSTVPRIPEKKVKGNSQNMGPGPGSYDISRPLVRPIIETLRKSNNNIIIKINEVGSAAFKGQTERFKQPRGKETPGPGQYYTLEQPSVEPKKNVHYSLHNYRNKFQDIFNTRRTQTIPQLKTISRPQRPLETIDVVANKQKHQRGVSWSKYAQERFKSPSNISQHSPGPGTYNQKVHIRPQQTSLHPSSSFVSQSVRSYFDRICFETNQDTKAQIRERLNYKSDLPGPGSYEIQQHPSKKIQNRFQFFGSTEERLLLDKQLMKQQKKPNYRRSPMLQRLAAKLMQDQNFDNNDISVDLRPRNNSLSVSIEDTPSSLSLIHQKQRIKRRIASVNDNPPKNKKNQQKKPIKMIFDQSQIL